MRFSEKIFIFLVVIGMIGAIIGGLFKVVIIILIYGVPSLIALFVLYRIFCFFSKSTTKDKQTAEDRQTPEELRRRAAEFAEYRAKEDKREADEAEFLRVKLERKIREERDEADRKTQREVQRKIHRDSEQQADPYTYQIGQHGNESLAIRYGIVNQTKKIREFYYHAKGGQKTRNPDRDQVYFEPANTICLRKIKKCKKDHYEVVMPDFGNRKALAVIEVGEEYVKTFYPLDEDWFMKHRDLELTLKNNGSFSLKELATFHIQKAIGPSF